jgi:hypothetical protein
VSDENYDLGARVRDVVVFRDPAAGPDAMAVERFLSVRWDGDVVLAR